MEIVEYSCNECKEQTLSSVNIGEVIINDRGLYIVGRADQSPSGGVPLTNLKTGERSSLFAYALVRVVKARVIWSYK